MKKSATLYRILQELAKAPATSHELADRLGLPFKSVASRLWELGEFGLVEHPFQITDDGLRAMEQLTLKPK